VTELKLDYSKANLFWEGTAKEIGDSYDELGATMLLGDPVWANYRHRMEKKHLFRLVRFNESMSVLDLGCGTGRWSFEFAKKCKSVLAVDFSPTFIEYANKAAREAGVGNVTFICQSITEFSYLENLQFDVIHLGSVLQYLNDESVRALINELRHHLRADGLLIERDSIAINQRIVMTSDYQCIYRTEDELLRMFQNNGFVLVYMNYNMFPALPCFLYRKLPLSFQKKRLSKGLLNLTLFILEKLNFVLLNQKWLFKLFIDPRRQCSHRFYLFYSRATQPSEESEVS